MLQFMGLQKSDMPERLNSTSERLLLNHERGQDSWPPEENNSIQGQSGGLITQSFCVIKFY